MLGTIYSESAVLAEKNDLQVLFHENELAACSRASSLSHHVSVHRVMQGDSKISAEYSRDTDFTTLDPQTLTVAISHSTCSGSSKKNIFLHLLSKSALDWISVDQINQIRL